MNDKRNESRLIIKEIKKHTQVKSSIQAYLSRPEFYSVNKKCKYFTEYNTIYLILSVSVSVFITNQFKAFSYNIFINRFSSIEYNKYLKNKLFPS